MLARDPAQYDKQYNSTVFQFLEKEGFNTVINHPVVREPWAGARGLGNGSRPCGVAHVAPVFLPFSPIQRTPQGDRCNYD